MQVNAAAINRATMVATGTPNNTMVKSEEANFKTANVVLQRVALVHSISTLSRQPSDARARLWRQYLRPKVEKMVALFCMATMNAKTSSATSATQSAATRLH